jgi:hypothetical protein
MAGLKDRVRSCDQVEGGTYTNKQTCVESCKNF